MRLIFTFLFLPLFAFAEEPKECGTTTGLPALGIFRKAALKVYISKKMTDENIGDFCDKDAQNDVIDNIKADGGSGDLTYQTPWHKAQTPDEALRKSSITPFGVDKYGKEIKDSDQTTKSNAKKTYANEKKQDKDKFGISSTNTEENQNYACKLLTLRHSDDCKKGLNQIVKIMDVTDTGHSLKKVQWDIVQNQEYKEPLLKAAHLIQNKVKTQNGDGDIFSDLKSSFEQSGLSKEQAKDLSWKMMGIWGSAGSNLRSRLEASGVDDFEPRVANAIESILTSIPYLDALAKKKGHRYALPNGVKAKCDQGKSYHFWMSAFLTRELVKNGISSEASTAATFTAQKGYQMLSATAGRNPSELYTRDEYDPKINRMRVDLSYAAAGSYFGANDALGKSYKTNIDNILRVTFKSAAQSPRLEKENAETILKNDPATAYRYFMMILSPDTAYRSLAP